MMLKSKRILKWTKVKKKKIHKVQYNKNIKKNQKFQKLNI